jgi:hypothetical protein
MHLNPLKKDDNTDALVKALEDANAAEGTNNPAPADEPAPADAPGDTASTAPASTPSAATDDDAEPTLPAPAPADPTASLSLGDSSLPGSLSSDADAHLPTPSASTGGGELDGVKKSALEQLRPLIEKLDLEPADKFDKYLMMLRASDDPALIKPAFDAAQGISGEKEKAQALLDIINEINYITANQTPQN